MGHTDLDGVISDQQGKRSNDGCEAGTLPVGDDTHGYASSIHAQVG
jgi:hypothetical protein